jgi:hypothetical protein
MASVAGCRNRYLWRSRNFACLEKGHARVLRDFLASTSFALVADPSMAFMNMTSDAFGRSASASRRTVGQQRGNPSIEA